MEIRQISTKHYDLNKESSLKHYLRKRVITKDGDVLGRVKNFIFEGTSIVGFIVGNGFNSIFVDLSYVSSLATESILLKINPVTRYIGMKVYDVDGKYIGKVKDIIRKTNVNKISAIITRKSVFSKYLEISAEEIETSKKNIILNTSKDLK